MKTNLIQLEEQRPIDRFLLVSKEGTSGRLKKTCRRTAGVSKEGPSDRWLKNVSPAGRGANDALIVRFLQTILYESYLSSQKTFYILNFKLFLFPLVSKCFRNGQFNIAVPLCPLPIIQERTECTQADMEHQHCSIHWKLINYHIKCFYNMCAFQSHTIKHWNYLFTLF